MSKKLLVMSTTMILAILWTSITFAQEKTADLSKVSIRFCNQTWESKHDDLIVMEPNEEKNLRLCINNDSELEANASYGFSKGDYSFGTRVCDNRLTDNRFSALFPGTQSREIKLKPLSSIVIEEKIIIPPGMSGMQNGCLMYSVSASNVNLWSMFSMSVSKYWYLDVMVGWEASVKRDIKVLEYSWGYFSTDKKIWSKMNDENNLLLKFIINNKGNISEKIIITGKVYNILWFQKEFSIDPQNVWPANSNEFTTNIGILPIYKWMYTVKYRITNEPQYVFPVSDEKLKQAWTVEGTGNIFIFSRILVGIAIALILFFIKILMPRRQNKDSWQSTI